MALSNWDTLAIDLDGNPTNGVFKSPKSGITVEIYKNWVYVRDAKAWHEGRYVNDVVLEIQSGSLHYQEVSIEAVRGPQNGIYVACWTVDYNVKDEKGKAKYHGMIGCGVYGFSDEDWVGVTKESLEFLKDWITRKHQVFDDAEIAFHVEDFVRSDRSKWPESEIKNMTPEQYKEHMKNTVSYDFDERIAKVDFSRALRFCQGDGYFGDTNGTPIGEAETPIFLQLLGEPKKDDKD
jgi:hypothetical protein